MITDDDRRDEMTMPHMTLWVRLANKKLNIIQLDNLNNNIINNLPK